MGQLHEVLAVLPSCKSTAQKAAGATMQMFKTKKEHFAGLLKTYEPVAEDGETLPAESSPLVMTVGERLRVFAQRYAPWLDAELQISATNQRACADLDVEGFNLPGVPATFLLQLDKRLSDLRGIYDEIPTLDPKHEWTTSTRGHGVSDANPEERNRSEKRPVHRIVAQATKEHPAQIAAWNEDKLIGKWTTQRWSGAISPKEKYELLARIDTLQKAVKRALSAANKQEHETARIGAAVFEYINGDLPLAR